MRPPNQQTRSRPIYLNPHFKSCMQDQQEIKIESCRTQTLCQVWTTKVAQRQIYSAVSFPHLTGHAYLFMFNETAFNASKLSFQACHHDSRMVINQFYCLPGTRTRRLPPPRTKITSMKTRKSPLLLPSRPHSGSVGGTVGLYMTMYYYLFNVWLYLSLYICIYNIYNIYAQECVYIIYICAGMCKVSWLG